MLGERERAEADRLPGRLVAGHDQERERVVEVLVGHRLPLDLAVGDQAEHVVAGAGAPVGVVPAPDRAQLIGPRGAERLVAILLALAGERVLANVLGVGVDEQPVAELDQVGQDLLRRPNTCASTRIGMGAASSWTRSNSPNGKTVSSR